MTSILNRTARVGAIALGALAFALACHAAARADGLPGRAYSTKDTYAPAFSWTGIYIGAGLGYQVSNTDADLNVGAVNVLGGSGFSGKGWAYDARIGADWHIQNTPFVVGLLAGYNGGETDFNIHGVALSPFNPITAHIHQTYYAGGRVGLAFNQSRSLAYVGYAFTKADFDVGVPVAGVCAPAALQCSHDLNGRMLLIGLETVIMPQVTIGAEYTFTDYSSANLLPANLAAATLNVDPDVHAFKVRLNWRPLNGMFGN